VSKNNTGSLPLCGILPVIKLLESYYEFAKKCIIQKICFFSLQYIVKENYGAEKCQQSATNLPSFNISLLQQFTEPRQVSQILGIVKKQVNLHDSDRLKS